MLFFVCNDLCAKFIQVFCVLTHEILDFLKLRRMGYWIQDRLEKVSFALIQGRAEDLK